MADESKSLLGLLNGLARHDYYGDKDITEDFLKSELYPDMSEGEFNALVQKSRGLTKSMASMNMDLNQLEIFLTSQTQKKEGGITEAQAKVYMKFWKSHKNKIHDSIVARCTWNNHLKSMNWRIDVKTRSRHLEQLNTPTAIIEMQIESGQEPDAQKDTEVLRFEMDESSLSKVLTSLKDIEDQITAYSQQ